MIELVEGEPSTFSDHLVALKDTGSLILVTGNDSAARTAVSSQLLGDPEKERVPVFVLLEQDRSVISERLETNVDDSQLVQYGFQRSAAAHADAESFPEPLTNAGALSTKIEQMLEHLETERGGHWAQGELRVCIDSFSPVLDEYDRSQIEGLLTDIRELMVTCTGMAHCVLPIDPVPNEFSWLPTCFDVVVGTRVFAGVPQQRWRLTEPPMVTDWFNIDIV